MKRVRMLFLLVFFTISVNNVLSAIVYKGFHGDIVRQYQHRLFCEGVLDEIALYCDVSPENSDQIAKKGEFAHYDGAKANIVMCHGFMCDHHDIAMLRYAIFDPGMYNILTFDFRAHGNNEYNEHTQYCTFGKNETQELLTAIRFLKNYPDKRISELPIIIYGFSMGAVVAIETIAKNPNLCCALILDCPFDSSEEVIKRSLENVNFELFGYSFSLPCKNVLQKYAFHPYIQGAVKQVLKAVANLDTKDIEVDLHPIFPKESIKNISVPCFFIHCAQDQKIPLSAVMEVYNNAPGYKRFWITTGRRHFDSFFYHPELYKKVIQGFLETVILKSPLIEVSSCAEASADRSAITTVEKKKEKIVIDKDGDGNIVELLEF